MAKVVDTVSFMHLCLDNVQIHLGLPLVAFVVFTVLGGILSAILSDYLKKKRAQNVFIYNPAALTASNAPVTAHHGFNRTPCTGIAGFATALGAESAAGGVGARAGTGAGRSDFISDETSLDQFSRVENDIWFKSLSKPAFNPPNWIFGPVWFLLYFCMAVAAYLTWFEGGGFEGCASTALFLYGLQLMINWTWSPLFFGQHRVFDALLLQMLLTFFIIVNILFMLPISTIAVYLMLPYLLWVLFATVLTFSIWYMNCGLPFVCN